MNLKAWLFIYNIKPGALAAGRVKKLILKVNVFLFMSSVKGALEYWK